MSFFQDHQIPKSWFITAFGIKIFFGILLTLIYTFYYSDQSTSDIYKYFNDGNIMFKAIKNNPIDYFKMLLGLDFDKVYFDIHYYNKMEYWSRNSANSNLLTDTHPIIRFNAFARLFSWGSIYVHTIFINFLSLIGLTAMFKSFRIYFPEQKRMLFYLIFLIPSVLFWGSGLLKEGLLFFALGLFILYFFKTVEKITSLNLLVLVFSLTMILFTKLYIVPLLLFSCLGWIIHKKTSLKKPIISYFSAFGIISSILFIISLFNNSYSPSLLIINKQRDFIQAIERYKPSTVLDISPFENTLDIISYIPSGLYNVFFEPFFGGNLSILTLISSLENLFFILFMLLPVFFLKKNRSTQSILYFVMSFAIPLVIIIGLTTAITGAIVRYKIPALIFISIGILTLLDVKKIKTKFSFLNKIL